MFAYVLRPHTGQLAWPRAWAGLVACGLMLCLGACTGRATDLGTSTGAGTESGAHGTPQPAQPLPGSPNTAVVPELLSPVHLAACVGPTQGTAFVPQAGVTYILTGDMHKGLQIAGNSLSSGAPLTEAAVNFTMDQLFTFEITTDGHVMLRAYHSEKLLGTDANGSVTQTDSNDVRSRWRVFTTDGNRYALVQDTVGGCLTLLDGNQTLSIVADKKGWAGSDGSWAQISTTFHPTWFYDWGTAGSPNTQPAETEYVPMVWGYYGDANGLEVYLTHAGKNPNVKHVLAYNEPDNAGQANLDVNLAISTWPMWEAMGKPTGSPAGTQATDAWMTTFMASVQDNVGFVTVHWYGGTSAQSLQDYLQAVYNAYHRPIWITEFAPADWNAGSVGQINFSQQDVTNFMAQAVPMLDALPFVQRYSWFEANPTDSALGHSTLMNADGSLTGAGQIYAHYPFVP